MSSKYPEDQSRALLLACCIAAFTMPLLSTMMNLSLVNIGNEFNVGSHDQAYVNTSFLLASVIFMVPLAKLGDIYGKRKVFISGLVVITASCIVAPFSPSFWFLIACRAICGIGSAAIITTSVSMITDVFPPERRGMYIGYNTTCTYIGLALGPAIGGVLNDVLGWHSLFLIVVPIAIASIVSMLRFRFEIAPDKGEKMGIASPVLYGAAILLTMGGIINMPETWAIAMLIIGLVVLVVFAVYQTRDPRRVLNVRLFRIRQFSGGCVAAFMNYAASYSVSFFMALYLQSIGALSSSQAGALMLCQPAIQALLTPYFGRLSDRMPDKRILPTAGMLISALGLAIAFTLDVDTPVTRVVLAMVTIGVGFSVFSAPNTSLVMGSVKPKDTGEASAMVAVMRQTGMMVSMGIAMLFISVIMGSMDNLAPETYPQFVQVIRCSFGVCVAMCVMGAVLSMLRGGKQPSV